MSLLAGHLLRDKTSFLVILEKEISDAIIKVDMYMNLIGTMKVPLNLCSL